MEKRSKFAAITQYNNKNVINQRTIANISTFNWIILNTLAHSMGLTIKFRLFLVFCVDVVSVSMSHTACAISCIVDETNCTIVSNISSQFHSEGFKCGILSIISLNSIRFCRENACWWNNICLNAANSYFHCLLDTIVERCSILNITITRLS